MTDNRPDLDLFDLILDSADAVAPVRVAYSELAALVAALRVEREQTQTLRKTIREAVERFDAEIAASDDGWRVRVLALLAPIGDLRAVMGRSE